MQACQRNSFQALMASMIQPWPTTFPGCDLLAHQSAQRIDPGMPILASAHHLWPWPTVCSLRL